MAEDYSRAYPEASLFILGWAYRVYANRAKASGGYETSQSDANSCDLKPNTSTYWSIKYYQSGYTLIVFSNQKVELPSSENIDGQMLF